MRNYQNSLKGLFMAFAILPTTSTALGKLNIINNTGVPISCMLRLEDATAPKQKIGPQKIANNLKIWLSTNQMTGFDRLYIMCSPDYDYENVYDNTFVSDTPEFYVLLPDSYSYMPPQPYIDSTIRFYGIDDCVKMVGWYSVTWRQLDNTYKEAFSPLRFSLYASGFE